MTTLPLVDFGLAPWPVFGEDEVEAASRVLRSGRVNYWTGEEGRHFETEFAAFAGTRHAVAMANGSVAIEAALAALGIGEGDEVIVTPRSFMASASSVVLRGATPVFAEVDPETGNLDPRAVDAAATERTRAIVAVHLAGMPCELDELDAVCRERGMHLIEDCAQAHGAEYKGRSVGSFGAISTWSFCQDKIMTTAGEGGMVTTNDPELWRRCWSLKDHGKDWDATEATADNAAFRWLHHGFGSNWRLTEVQSATGRIQLGKLRGWVETRRALAARLIEGLKDVSALRVPEPPPHVRHAYYKFYAYVRPGALADGWSRDRIVAEVRERGVPCFSGSCSEVYREKAFVDAGLGPAEPLPVARELGETSLMLLVHPTLSAEHMDGAVGALRDVCAQATR